MSVLLRSTGNHPSLTVRTVTLPARALGEEFEASGDELKLELLTHRAIPVSKEEIQTRQLEAQASEVERVRRRYRRRDLTAEQ